MGTILQRGRLQRMKMRSRMLPREKKRVLQSMVTKAVLQSMVRKKSKSACKSSVLPFR